MSSFDVKVTNINKVIDNIEKYRTDVKEKTQQVLAEGGERIQNEAQSRAPVRTGTLRGSIESRTEDMRVEVVATTDYAAFVEFGTRNQEPQPFLTPAFELILPQIERDIEEALKNAE